MRFKYIEATNNRDGVECNWGKFLLLQWDEGDWSIKSTIDAKGLLSSRGWTPDHLWVMDIEAGEGACFLLGGCAAADLERHPLYVCPLFQPFLTWLYKQDFKSIEELPSRVNLPDAPGALYGYRRRGPLA